MKWELATDEQLLTIIRSDANIPIQLLGGVVTEMLKRNLFDGLIIKAIKQRFILISTACGMLDTSKEDLLQTLRLEIWDKWNKFVPGKSPFGFYAYLKISGRLKDIEKGFDYGSKKILHHLQSVETQVTDTMRIEDFLSSHVNVEKTVINKITFEEKLNVLSAKEKTVFNLYLQGYSTNEIGNMVGVSKSGAKKRLQNSLTKLTGNKINLKEYGNGNFKRGA